MALRKTTKSVLFYKGMSDDSERFLAKSPAVDYTENLYEERTGSYSKRHGFTSLGLAGPIDPLKITDPFVLHGVGDSLYTLSADAGHRYSGTSWGSIENNGDISVRSLEILAKTNARPSARDFTFCISPDGDYHVIAFSIKPPDGQRMVVIQSFAMDGTFMGEQRILNCVDPQVFPGLTNDIRMFYVQEIYSNDTHQI